MENANLRRLAPWVEHTQREKDNPFFQHGIVVGKKKIVDWIENTQGHIVKICCTPWVCDDLEDPESDYVIASFVLPSKLAQVPYIPTNRHYRWAEDCHFLLTEKVVLHIYSLDPTKALFYYEASVWKRLFPW